MKSKDVLDVLSGKGIVLKSQATLDASQFEVLFDALTKENQIDNIGNYLDGVTYIPSKKAATPKPEKETVKAEEKKEAVEQKSAKTAPSAEAPVTSAAPKTDKPQKPAVQNAAKAEQPAQKKFEQGVANKPEALVSRPAQAQNTKPASRDPEARNAEQRPQNKPAPAPRSSA